MDQIDDGVFFSSYQHVTALKNRIKSKIIPDIIAFDSDRSFLLDKMCGSMFVGKLSAFQGEAWIQA